MTAETWRDRRILATNTFGIAANIARTKKYVASIQERSFVAINNDNLMSSLSDRVRTLEATKKDRSTVAEETARRILPAWNPEAVEPHHIYEKGLEEIAPTHMMEEEQGSLIEEEMVSIFRDRKSVV